MIVVPYVGPRGVWVNLGYVESRRRPFSAALGALVVGGVEVDPTRLYLSVTNVFLIPLTKRNWIKRENEVEGVFLLVTGNIGLFSGRIFCQIFRFNKDFWTNFSFSVSSPIIVIFNEKNLISCDLGYTNGKQKKPALTKFKNLKFVRDLKLKRCHPARGIDTVPNSMPV